MKLYRVIILRDKKEITRATGDNLKELEDWALRCQKEDNTLTYEIYEEV